jgi:hypothetical protein
MQPRPTASEILTVVAEVLEQTIVPALTGPAQHQARVAANLVGIVEREVRLGPDIEARELEMLRTRVPNVTDVREARARLVDELRAGAADDPAAEREIWAQLFASVRDDLTICKPGHDSWEGQ